MAENQPIIPNDLSLPPVEQMQEVTAFTPATPETYNPSPVQDITKMNLSQVLGQIPSGIGKNEGNAPVYSPEQLTKRYPQFNPFVDNEENYAQNQGTISRFWNATVKTAGLASSAFVDGLLAIPDAVRTVAGGSPYKNAWAQELDEWTKNLEDKFPNYYSQWEKDHPFASAIPFSGGAANFWFDKVLKNTGYTIGAIGSAVVQDAAVGAITGGLGELPLISAQVGKASLFLNKLFSGTNKLEQVLSATSGVTKTQSAAFSLKGLAALSEGAKITSGARYLTTLAGASHTEAAIEARDGYNSVKQELIDQFYKEKGYYPIENDLGEIEKIATAAGNTRYGINLALLSISNAIQFENIIKPFSSFRNSLKTGLQSTVPDQAGKIVAKNTATAAGISELSTLTSKGIMKYVKPVIPNILSEGIFEEGGQFAAQKGVEKYFKDKYNGTTAGTMNDMLSATMYGLSQQFGSTEGLENILLGSITGALFSPISTKIGNVKKSRAGIFTPEQALNSAANQLNSKGVLGLFSDNYENTANSLKRKSDLVSAIENNDVFSFKNLKADEFYDFISSGIKSGRHDVRLEQLRLLKELPADEFNKLFAIEESDRKDALSYVNTLIDKAEDIKKTHDAISSIFQNPYQYKGNNNTEEGIRENEAYLAFEDYKNALTKFSYRAQDYNSRLQSIQQELTEIAPLVTPDILSNVTSPAGLKELATDYGRQAAQIQQQVDQKLFQGKDRVDALERIKTFNNYSSAIKSFLNSTFDSIQAIKLIPELLSFELNGQTRGSITIPKEQAQQLITFGNDINRINAAKEVASQAYDYLFTQEGFDDFMKNYKEWKDGFLETPEEVEDTTEQPSDIGRKYTRTTPYKPYVVSEVDGTFDVKSPTGEVVNTYPTKEEAETERDYLNNNIESLNEIEIISQQEDGTYEVRDKAGNILTIPNLDNYQKVKTEEEIVAERTEFNEKIKSLQDKKTSSTATPFPTGDNEGDISEQQRVKESSKKPIDLLFSSTTYSDKDTKPYTQRQQYFLSQIENYPNRDKLSSIIVTANTEEALGLKGLTQLLYPNFNKMTDPKEGVIATVFIENNNGKRSFVNKEGKPIGKLGEQVDLNEAIFGVLPTAALSYRDNTQESRYSRATPEEATAFSEAWQSKRDEIFKWTGSQFEEYPFVVSRGIPRVNPQIDGKYEENSVVGSFLKDVSELDNGIYVKISTTGSITHQGLEINFPVGRTVFQHGSTLEWLNNRKLTTDEVNSVYKVLSAIVSDINTSGKIEDRYVNYLQGIVHYAAPKSGQKVSNNQLWFSNGFFYFGNNEQGIPATPAGFQESEDTIKGYLSGMFNNVNKLKLDSNLPYEEILDITDEGVQSITWKSYQHYLLSPSYQLTSGEKSGTRKLPLSTKVRKINKDVPNDTNFFYKYATLLPTTEGTSLFQLPELQVEPTPTEQSAPQEKQVFTTSSGDLYYVVTPEGLVEFDNNEAFQKTIEKIKANSEIMEALRSQVPAGTSEDDIAFLYIVSRIQQSTQPQQPVTVQQEEKVEQQAKEVKQESKLKTTKKPSLGYGKSEYRLALNNYNYTLANLDKEEQWAKDNLNIPLNRLKNLIRTTGGGYAFGMFKDAVIYIYENAEVGTTYHEAFEAVWAMFTDLKEKKSILNEFASRKGTYIDRETGTTLSYSAATEQQAKEQLAEEFRDYVMNNEKPRGNAITRFFRDLYNFIKSLLKPNVNTVEDLFKRINSGYYKNSVPKTTFYDEQYRIANIPNVTTTDTYTVVKGITASIFQKLFTERDNALVEFDENPASVSEVFNKVRQEMSLIFTSNEYEDTIPDLYERGEISEEQYTAYQNLWNNINSNWNVVTQLTQEYLNTFGIVAKVEENLDNEVPESQEDTISETSSRQDSYLQDTFRYDFKKNASSSVKLLFATLTEAQFEATQTKDLDTPEVKGVTSKLDTATYMQQMVNYAKSFNFVMNQVFDANTFEEKSQRIAEIAQKYPNYVRLYNRLKLGNTDVSIDDWKLRVRAYNVFAKQRPLSYIQYVDASGEVYTQSANLSDAKNQMINGWISAWKLSSPFMDQVDGVYTFDGTKLKSYDSIINKTDGQIRFLNDLGIDFSMEEYNKLSSTDKNTFSTNVKGLQYSLKAQKGVTDINAKNLKSVGNLQNIAELSIKAKGEGYDSTFTNIEGEAIQQYVQNNYISNITNDINNSISKDDLLSRVPQLNNLYSQDSVYLEKMFDASGKKVGKNLNIGYIQGTINLTLNKPQQPISRLGEGQRFLLQVNQNLNKRYYVLVPADSKTEWMLEMDHIFSLQEFDKSDVWDRVHTLFNRYYQTERQLAQDNPNYKGLLKKINSDYNSPELSKEKLTDYIGNLTNSSIEFLRSYDIITEFEGKYNVQGIDSAFQKVNKLKDMNEADLKRLFAFITTNAAINNIELHKLYFGDVSQIKDPLKRYKSFESPREASFYGDENFNITHNEKLNYAGDVKLQPTDVGYTHFKENMATVTMQDVDSSTESIVDDTHLPEALKSAYNKNNGTDAQSWATLSAYREIMIKSGYRWTDKHENQYQYLMAVDRNLMEADGLYTYSSEALKKHDNNLISAGDLKSATFAVVKPVGTGVTTNLNTFLDKTSLVPLTYQAAKGRNLATHYNKMIKQGISYLIVESGRKIGNTGMDSFYNEDGSVNTTPYNNIVHIPFRYYGIQVETQASKNKTTIGTQLSKLAPVNLLEEGEGTPEVQELVNHYTEVFKALHNHGYNSLLDRFGIVDDGVSYSIPDKTKIEALLQDELFRREATSNLRDAITLNPETGEFNIPFESIPQYQQIKNILYSYVDKLIAKPKLNGGPKIQVSGSLWEVGNRTISKTGKAFTSAGLKFYEAQYNDKGERTSVSRMEVLLPNWFRKKLKAAKIFQNNTDEEILEYLNKNSPEVLQGIGFRIPTQDINSVEAFTVAGFLPDYMGDTIVVPEAITTKAGSDFDVDKLNTYLKNIYITSAGDVKVIPYFGTGEQAIQKLEKLIDGVESKEQFLSEMLSDDFLYVDTTPVEEIYRQSLENEYFRTIEQLMLLPQNFERLIRPNSAKELKDIRNTLVSLAPEEFGGMEEDILSPLYMSRMRHLFLVGKGGVGIAAVAQTNNALNQLGKVYIDPSRIPTLQEYQRKYIGDASIALPHNTIEINGVKYPTLSKQKDIQNRYISDKVSQYIDGFVDIAKDPFIAQILQSPVVTSTALTLEKLGVPSETVALFLNQPIIREYIKALSKTGSTWLYNSTMLDEVRLQFPAEAPADGLPQNPKVLNAVLKDNISKFYTDKNKFNQRENEIQQLILDEFLKYSIFATNLFDITQGTSYDTDSSADPNMQYYKQQKTNDARTSNIFSSIDQILDNSFIGNLKEVVQDASDAVSQSLTKIDNPEVRSYINYNLDYLRRIKGLSRSNFEKAARNVEESLISFIAQTNTRLNSRIKELFTDAQNSVANNLISLKKNLPKDSTLYNNIVLKQLIPSVKNKTSEVKNITLLGKVSDAYTSDTYTEAFRELKNNPLTSELYSNLIRLSFLQSGIAKNPFSFSEYIPLEDYNMVVTPILNRIESLDNLQNFVETDAFFRNYWNNDDIVPQVDERWQEGDFGYFVKNRKPTTWFNNLREKYGIKDARFNPYAVSTQSNKSSAKFITMNTYKQVFNEYEGDFKLVKDGKILLRRLDNENGEPVQTPYSEFYPENTYNTYIPINAWGDGIRLQEYYNQPQQSVIENDYLKVPEISEQEILDAYNGVSSSADLKAKPFLSQSQTSLEKDVSLSLIGKWSRESKKRVFTVKNGLGETRKVEGYKVTLEDYPEVNSFVYKMEGTNDWSWVEESSGLSFGANRSIRGNSAKDAIRAGIEKLNEIFGSSSRNNELLEKIGFKKGKCKNI